MDAKEKAAKNRRIKKEIKRLNAIFEMIEPNEKQSIDGLIKRTAYMRITLEDFEKDLTEHGSVEMFTQSVNTKPYERERPVARLYNSMNKNYQSICKQLNDMLPKKVEKREDDGFGDFVNGRDEM